MRNINSFTKLTIFLTFGIITFVANNLLILISLSIILLNIALVSKIKIKTILKSLKPSLILFILLILLFMNNIKNGTILFSFWNIDFHQGVFYYAGFYSLRMWNILLAGIYFSKTTEANDFIIAIEKLLFPLKYLGINIDKISISIMITFKLIPEYISDAKKIILSNKFKKNRISKYFIVNRTMLFLTLFTPLFIIVFKKSQSTYESLYIIGYSEKGRKTKYQYQKLSYIDFLIFFVLLFLIVIIVMLRINPSIIPLFGENWW